MLFDMYIPKPRVAMMVDVTVDELKSKGVDLTISDIIWLYELAKNQILPTASRPPTFLTCPIRVRKVWFYPLTVQARMWLEMYASKWWPLTDEVFLNCFAMAHCGGDSEDYFPSLTNRFKALGEYTKWCFRTLNIDHATLEWVCKTLTNAADEYVRVTVDESVYHKPSDDEEQVVDWGESIAYVACISGIPPKTLWELDDESFTKMEKAACLAAKGPMREVLQKETENSRGLFLLAKKYLIKKHEDDVKKKEVSNA